MEGVLPFEYGYLYKIVSNSNINEINNSLKIDTDSIGGYMGYNSYTGMNNGYYTHNGIDNTKYFHPIGYIPSTEQVVLEVFIEEKEVIQNQLYMSGMSFGLTNMEKVYKKISRATVDVNVFIRNFEKVL